MPLKNKILLSILIFLLVYPLFLVVWIKVKSYYGYGMAHVGVYLSASTMGSSVKEIVVDKEDAKITLIRPFYKGLDLADLVIEIKLSVSKYSFNVPLSLALITALFPLFRWRRRSLIEVVMILLSIHLLYIYSFCCLQQYYLFLQAGIKSQATVSQFFWEFLWGFTDNMVIRFEPFLLVIYLWFKNQRFSGKQEA